MNPESLGFSRENPSTPIETRGSIYVALFSLVFVKKRVNPTAGAFQKPTSVSQPLSILELLEEICQVRKIKAKLLGVPRWAPALNL